MAGQLIGAGSTRIVVAAANRSPMVAFARAHQLAVLTPDAQGQGQEVLDLFPPRSGSGEPTVVLVDDAELFLDSAAGDHLASLARSGRSGLGMFVTGRSDDLAMTFRGVAAEIKRARTGLLLQPGAADGDVLGVRLPFGRTVLPAGRAVLVAPGLMHLEDGSRPAHGHISVQLATP